MLESVCRASVQDERGNMRRMLRDRATERLGKRGKDILCRGKEPGLYLEN